MFISMKSIYIYALVVTCLIVKGYSETLQCYGCDECEELDDSMLQSCPPDETTPSPSAEEESPSKSDASLTPVEDILADTKEAINVSTEVNYKSVSYQCLSIVKVDNEKRIIKKGCVEVPENEKGCDLLSEVEGVSKENCMLCSETKCNSSVGLKYSIVTVFVVAVMKAFL